MNLSKVALETVDQKEGKQHHPARSKQDSRIPTLGYIRFLSAWRDGGWTCLACRERWLELTPLSVFYRWLLHPRCRGWKLPDDCRHFQLGTSAPGSWLCSMNGWWLDPDMSLVEIPQPHSSAAQKALSTMITWKATSLSRTCRTKTEWFPIEFFEFHLQLVLPSRKIDDSNQHKQSYKSQTLG